MFPNFQLFPKKFLRNYHRMWSLIIIKKQNLFWKFRWLSILYDISRSIEGFIAIGGRIDCCYFWNKFWIKGTLNIKEKFQHHFSADVTILNIFVGKLCVSTPSNFSLILVKNDEPTSHHQSHTSQWICTGLKFFN